MTRLGRFAPLIGLGIFLIAVIWRLATPMDTNVSSKLRNQPVPILRKRVVPFRNWYLGLVGAPVYRVCLPS